ncbi:MAG: OadG family protein [Anaerovoracaceae bacterium]|jgi:predicted lipid-binding transport protein (Tim44 family)
MSLMEQFANPDLVHQLSFGDKLAGAGITTLMGMGTTFVILILLWGIIAITTRIMALDSKGKSAPVAAAAAGSAAAPASAPAAAPASSAPAAEAEPAKAEDDEALAAVIAAAIAAYEGGTVQPDLIVKRIRRVSGPSTVWANAGRNESVDSRKI